MIICKSPAEIEKLRRAGTTARQILEEMRQLVRPGITTLELEKFAEKRVSQLDARSAFKGYRGYPCCLCTSVNEEIIHGIPSGRRLAEGDILPRFSTEHRGGKRRLSGNRPCLSARPAVAWPRVVKLLEGLSFQASRIKRRLRPTSDCRCAAEMVAEWLPI